MQTRVVSCVHRAMNDNFFATLWMLLLTVSIYRWAPDEPYIGIACFILLVCQVLSHVESYKFFQYTYDVTKFTIHGREYEIGHRDAFVRRYCKDPVLPEGVVEHYNNPDAPKWLAGDMVHHAMQGCYSGDNAAREVIVFNYDIVIVPKQHDDLNHVQLLTKVEWKYGNKLVRFRKVKMMFNGCLLYPMEAKYVQ